MQLLQEKYDNNDPWRILLICILLNRTQGKTAGPIIKRFFEQWPTAEDLLVTGNQTQITAIIGSLGLGRVRASYIMRLTEMYISSKGHVNPICLPGVGDYAYDAYKMFVLHKYDFIPKDKELCRRMQELQH